MPLDTKYHYASSEKRMAKKFQEISRYDPKKMGHAAPVPGIGRNTPAPFKQLGHLALLLLSSFVPLFSLKTNQPQIFSFFGDHNLISTLFFPSTPRRLSA